MRCPTLAELPPPPPDKTGWPWTEETASLPETMPDGSPWPRISIVTPSYNQGQFIEETIRSVLLQGYPNLEYIIMDGGSTDNSVEIIKKYEPWLTYWVSEKDRGQSHAINKGFEKSTGEIMAWINSDDYYAFNIFYLVATQLSGKKNALFQGGTNIFEQNAPKVYRYIFGIPNREQLFFDGVTFLQSSVFWTRDLYIQIGNMDENLYYVMDYDLWLRMYPNVFSFISINIPCSFFRLHSSQKSQFPGNQKYTDELIIANLRAANQQGYNSYLWFIKICFYRIKTAFTEKKIYKLKLSSFQVEMIKYLFFRYGKEK
ncbi:MAG: hypothetical protein HONDAALG_04136 [Gammaproteobacteria bacterium]|nr:hypothetical protein [Gammaproteobacteria bacterium]